MRAMLLEIAGYDIEILSEGGIYPNVMFKAVKRRGIKDDEDESSRCSMTNDVQHWLPLQARME
jgi:hypothetical protein